MSKLLKSAKALLALIDDVPVDPKLGDQTDRVFPRYEFDDLRAAIAEEEAKKQPDPNPPDPDDPNLALWFTPQCIRDHFDIDEVHDLTDEQLVLIGQSALSDDGLYRAFHESLNSAVKEVAGFYPDELESEGDGSDDERDEG